MEALINGVTMIVDFFAALVDTVLNIIEMAAKAIVGVLQLLGYSTKIVDSFSMFEEFFSPLAWAGVMGIFGILITILVLKIVNKVI